MEKLKTLCTAMLFVLFAKSAIAQYSPYIGYVPTITADRRVDWRNAGDNEKPTSYDQVFNALNYNAVPNDGIDDREAIQNAIEAARTYILNHQGSYVAVYLPQGIYNINSGGITLINDVINNVNIDYSNICIKGDGSDKTKLIYPGSNKEIAINIKGRKIDNITTITAGYHKGDGAITIASTVDYNIGDYVEIVTNFPLEFHQVGQVNRVTNKTGTQLILEDKMSINYNLGSSLIQVRKLAPIKNVGIEDIAILRDAISGMWNNTIQYTYAAKCWMLGVESSYAYKNHVSIDKSTFIEIRGSYFHGASGFGSGGRGYGVEIEDHSTNCLVEDNIFNHLRHAMIVQSGANRNVFGYNYSWDRVWEFWDGDPFVGTADISVHGNYAYANLFEGNKVELIQADDEHTIMNGPYNTFFRNDVENGKIYLNSADYSNTLGNYVTAVLSDGSPSYPPFYQPAGSANVLDFGAATYFADGTIYPYTHSQYFAIPAAQASASVWDFSYYLDAEPSYFSQYPSVTWPPLGVVYKVWNYNVVDWPAGRIPAYERKISGGKYTLNGPPLQSPLPSTFIYGPEIAYAGVDETWLSSTAGGTQPYQFQWWYKYPGGGGDPLSLNSTDKTKKVSKKDSVHTDQAPAGDWNPMSVNNPVLTRHDYQDYYLKCVVTDANSNVATSNIMYIDVIGGFAPSSTPLTNNELKQNGLEKTVVEEKITEDKLFYNYPNPFNPSTVIYFTLKSAGYVNLKVYNILGQEVATLLNEYKSPGRYNIPFKADNLPSGVYIYRLVSDNYSAIGKMNLMK